jgi:hypothetical protein
VKKTKQCCSLILDLHKEDKGGWGDAVRRLTGVSDCVNWQRDSPSYITGPEKPIRKKMGDTLAILQTTI